MSRRNMTAVHCAIGAWLICGSSVLIAEEAVKVPRSDARVLHVDFENYTDGVVQALNAGVRWLGDPFSGRKEGTTSVTRGFSFAGRRAGHTSTTAIGEIGRIRLQARYDAPAIEGDSMFEFVFRPARDELVKMQDFMVCTGRSRDGQPAGLVLHATSVNDGTYELDVTHASPEGRRVRLKGAITKLPQRKWVRVVQYRRPSNSTVELFVGTPGAETHRGAFPDLNSGDRIEKVELGDASKTDGYGTGYWDDVRVGAVMQETGTVAPPEPPLRDVSQQTVKVAEPISVGQRKQLFCDDAMIAGKTGITRTQHSPRKHDNNPLIVPEHPWESQSVLLYGGVIHDAHTDRFRMWYLAWGKHVGQDSFICYAESTDGLTWTKPKLGVVAFKGSKQNNIVMPGWSQTSVLRDPHDPDPQRRFKALLRYNGMRGFTSPDGIHWKDVGVLLEQAFDGTTLHWDPVNEKWIAMVKIFKDGKRARGYAESSDFLHWTDTYFMSATDADDAQDDQMYAMSVFHYETIYAGLLRMYHLDNDKIDIQLAFSRNATSWHRPSREPFIATSQDKGSWDYGNNAVPATPPIRVGEQLYFFYCGRSTLHDEIPNTGAIGLATLRLDGFVSLDADESGGTVTTRPLRLDGSELHVNANASRGEIRVEVLDASGDALEGFSTDVAKPLQGDKVDHTVAWQSANAPWPDKTPVRLRFHMKSARLYSFWCEP